jgi:hypothetical protein
MVRFNAYKPTAADKVQQYQVGDYVHVRLDAETVRRSGQPEWSPVGRVWDVLPPKDKAGRQRWKYRVRVVSWGIDSRDNPSDLASYAAAELKPASKQAFDDALTEIAKMCLNMVPGQRIFEHQGREEDEMTVLVGPFSRVATNDGYLPIELTLDGTAMNVNKIHYRRFPSHTGVILIARKAGRPPRKVRIEKSRIPLPNLVVMRRRGQLQTL